MYTYVYLMILMIVLISNEKYRRSGLLGSDCAKVETHLGMRTLCWNNFGNNRMRKESGIMLE